MKEISERKEELEEYKTIMYKQIDDLNQQFKMDVIRQFIDFEAVEKANLIIFQSVGIVQYDIKNLIP